MTTNRKDFSAQFRQTVISEYDAMQGSAFEECKAAYPDEEADVREARAHQMAIEWTANHLNTDEQTIKTIVEGA